MARTGSSRDIVLACIPKEFGGVRYGTPCDNLEVLSATHGIKLGTCDEIQSQQRAVHAVHLLSRDDKGVPEKIFLAVDSSRANALGGQITARSQTLIPAMLIYDSSRPDFGCPGKLQLLDIHGTKRLVGHIESMQTSLDSEGGLVVEFKDREHAFRVDGQNGLPQLCTAVFNGQRATPIPQVVFLRPVAGKRAAATPALVHRPTLVSKPPIIKQRLNVDGALSAVRAALSLSLPLSPAQTASDQQQALRRAGEQTQEDARAGVLRLQQRQQPAGLTPGARAPLRDEPLASQEGYVCCPSVSVV